MIAAPVAAGRNRRLGRDAIAGDETSRHDGLTGRRRVVRATVGLDYCFAIVIAVSLAQPAFALDPRYPDWPCQQLKVPEISIASVWSGPPIDAVDSSKPGDPREADLVPR